MGEGFFLSKKESSEIGGRLDELRKIYMDIFISYGTSQVVLGVSAVADPIPTGP
jgi:hypothetical protein